ncbi:hypothetical protein K438DRAFT_1935469 [Mycena galopus ATCC 62051]|nr:hypothetical protein K438DRAFT_1935469 [Mycena galopus ATCC 62051]
MNPIEYTTAITNELRGWAQSWIEGLCGIRQQQPFLGLPTPYPNYPLPVGFPFDQFTLSETFEWIHEDGTEQRRHIYNVALVLEGRTNGPDSSVAWRVVNTADRTPLGIFEIAGPIYDSANLPFRIDTDLILEAMSASLRERAPVHLASRVDLAPDPDPNGMARPFRIYELRTPNPSPVVIRTLGMAWEVRRLFADSHLGTKPLAVPLTPEKYRAAGGRWSGGTDELRESSWHAPLYESSYMSLVPTLLSAYIGYQEIPTQNKDKTRRPHSMLLYSCLDSSTGNHGRGIDQPYTQSPIRPRETKSGNLRPAATYTAKVGTRGWQLSTNCVLHATDEWRPAVSQLCPENYANGPTMEPGPAGDQLGMKPGHHSLAHIGKIF